MTTNADAPLPPGGEEKTSDHDTRPKVRIVSSGGGYNGRGDLHVDIHGLDTRELELMKGAMHGYQWVRCVSGRIETTPAYEPLPDQLQDEAMTPFWRRPAQGEEAQLNLFSFEPLPVHASPSITIGSLCGYNYSTENYKAQATNLMRWGFVCLRSRRDDSGMFWENWYLPGLWAAKEELKLAIDALDPYVLETNRAKEWLKDYLFPEQSEPPKSKAPRTEKEKKEKELETAVNFLSHNAQFGTLDISIQRAAMVIDG